MAAEEPRDTFLNLRTGQYVALTTYRRNGEPVTTPVWFALEGDRVYVRTARDAGKMKRIRHTPRVRIAPSTWSGKPRAEPVGAVVRILGPDEAERADRLLRRKYGWQRWVPDLMGRIRGTQTAFLEIRPE